MQLTRTLGLTIAAVGAAMFALAGPPANSTEATGTTVNEGTIRLAQTHDRKESRKTERQQERKEQRQQQRKEQRQQQRAQQRQEQRQQERKEQRQEQRREERAQERQRKERGQERRERREQAQERRQEQRQQQRRQERAQERRQEQRQQQRRQERAQERRREQAREERRTERDRRLRRETTRVVRSRDGRVVTRTRKVVDRRGNVRTIRSRRVIVREPRYRNRFRGGISVFWTPPVGVTIARDRYVVRLSAVPAPVIYETLIAPPVVKIQRRYTIEEIVDDPEIRSAVRSVDIDSINFASGEAEIPTSEYGKLAALAEAMKRIIDANPNEVFLIEGHTDAVGSDESNLELSELRAESVLIALVDEFGIPEENLETVGYGEQYLLVDTQASEPRNRRVVVRRITELVQR